MTQSEPQFKLGDRVQLKKPIGGVMVGTLGTIVRVYPAASLYDVRFDGQAAVRAVSADAIAPAPKDTPAP